MRDKKKFIFYSAVLLIGYLCLMLILPSQILVMLWAVIAGWTIGGWAYTLSKKWSTVDDNTNDVQA